MVKCPRCHGKGKMEVTVHGSDAGGFTMDCISCDGAGKVTKREAAAMEAEAALWCSCGNPSEETTYVDDHESPVVDKHHWVCNDCGKVVQIG